MASKDNQYWCEICELHVQLGTFENQCNSCGKHHLIKCEYSNCEHNNDTTKLKYKQLTEELGLINEYLKKIGYNKRKNIIDSVKNKIFQRDNYACTKCGNKEKLHIDHIVPVSLGGTNNENNLQVLCSTCNLRKNNKNAIQYAEV